LLVAHALFVFVNIYGIYACYQTRAISRGHNQEQGRRVSIKTPSLIYTPQKHLLLINLDNLL
jgi:hypothetical protein